MYDFLVAYSAYVDLVLLIVVFWLIVRDITTKIKITLLKDIVRLLTDRIMVHGQKPPSI